MKAKNLRVGMKVRIAAHESGDNSNYSHSDGYDFTWHKTMSKYVGEEYFVIDWEDNTVALSNVVYGYARTPYLWPVKCLKIVKE